QLRVHNRSVRDCGCRGRKNRIRRRQHLHTRRESFRSAGSALSGDVQPAANAIECARAKIQIHREKSVGESWTIGDGTGNLIAAAEGVVKSEDHRVSAIGVRAAVAELALIRERGGALSSGLIDASAQRQTHEQIFYCMFHWLILLYRLFF